LQDLLRRRRRRQYRQAAAAIGEHAQNIPFDAVVERGDVEATAGAPAIAVGERPAALFPRIRLARAHDFCEIHSFQAREGSRLRERDFFIRLLAGGGRDDAAVLRALVAQQPREAARVDVGDADQAMALHEVGERLRRAEIARAKREVAHDQPFGVDSPRLHVLRIGAGVADVRIRERDNLLIVGRISQNLLIPRHRGVEDHLADGAPGNTDRLPVEQRAIFQSQQCGRHQRNDLARRRAEAGAP
jgi:hypothetical protein